MRARNRALDFVSSAPVASQILRALASIAALLAACSEEPLHGDPQLDAGASDAAIEKDASDLDASEPDAGEPDASEVDGGELDAAEPDSGISESSPPRPILFVHGIGGSSTEFQVMIARLIEDGWPPEYLRAIDFEDPRWGCNVDNADMIMAAVSSLMADTGEPRVDIVAHSMGTLSSRYYLKNLAGTDVVNTYVTLGGMHHGIASACLNPLPVCVWQELCGSNPFLTQLNEDPATPGELFWVSIYSTDDDTVPTSSSQLDGAENIEVMGVEHAGPDGLLEHITVYPHVLRVVGYPAW